MTDLLYGNLPTFTAGQVLSASAHLNTVNRYIGSVRDDCFGTSIPYIGNTTNIIRHRWNTLTYYVIANGAGAIIYNGSTVASWASSGTKSGTADLSALGLTVGNFYSITVTGTNPLIYQLYETTTPSYPSLATFADGTTPTAAQWQDLADYAEELGDMLNHPYSLSTRWRGRSATTLACGVTHKARYLFIDALIIASDDGPHTSASLQFMYDPLGPAQQIINTWSTTNRLRLRAYIDMTTEVPALSFTDVYNFSLHWSGDGLPDFWLYAVYETPCNASSCSHAQATGYANPTMWEHGDYVYGSTSDPKVQQITANLAALDDAVTPHNWACPLRYEGDNAFLFGVRHRRWLHYMSASYVDDDTGDTVQETPVLAYNLRGAETTVSLIPSSTEGQWMAADLDSVEGLWPGVSYHIGAARYAIEDVEP